MTTDLGGWLEFARNEAVGYVDWLLNALLRPSYMGRQALKWSAESQPGAEHDGTLTLQLIPIVGISIFVGATIGAIIPNRPPMKDRATVEVVVVVLWIFVSLIVHGLIAAAGGRGTLRQTLWTMLQILALAYVVSNTLALFGVSALVSVGKSASIQPGSLIIALQFLLLLVYLPLSLREVHQVGAAGAPASTLFGTLLGLLITTVSAAVAVIFGWMTLASGGCALALGPYPRLEPTTSQVQPAVASAQCCPLQSARTSER